MVSHYTREEDLFIIRNRIRMTTAEMAVALGRPFYGFKSHVHVLLCRGWLSPISMRAKRHSENRGRLWTEAEDIYLLTNWGLLPKVEIAAHLQRTVAACKGRTIALGITQMSNWYRDSLVETEAA